MIALLFSNKLRFKRFNQYISCCHMSKENSSTYGSTSLRLLLPNIPLYFFAKEIEAASPLPMTLLLS